MPELTIANKKQLVLVAPKPEALYADLSLAALTAYSLYWLHQWELEPTIEAVAILNWRLFPRKFAMAGFAEYPDAFRTNRSLMQCQPKYRNLLTGSATQGFSLRDKGLAVAHDLLERLGPPQTSDGEALGGATSLSHMERSDASGSVDPHAAVQHAKAGRLYEKWKDGTMADRDLIHVHSLLKVFDHTPARVRERAMKDIERACRDVHDEECQQFLRDVRRMFPSAFRRRG